MSKTIDPDDKKIPVSIALTKRLLQAIAKRQKSPNDRSRVICALLAKAIEEDSKPSH